MRKLNSALFLAALCLLALAPAIAFSDNGVERGTIDYSPNTVVPVPVRAYLDKLIFTRCNLSGAKSVEPNLYSEESEVADFGLQFMRYRFDLIVTFKSGLPPESIYVELAAFNGGGGAYELRLNSISSSLCK